MPNIINQETTRWDIIDTEYDLNSLDLCMKCNKKFLKQDKFGLIIVIIIFEFNNHDYQFNQYCVKFALVHITTHCLKQLLKLNSTFI